MNSKLKISSAPHLQVKPHSSAKTSWRGCGFDLLPDSAWVRAVGFGPKSQAAGLDLRPAIQRPPRFWRKVKNGSFVKPYKLSERVTAWKVGEVRAWMAAQATV
jgi:prophage regulatory protein